MKARILTIGILLGTLAPASALAVFPHTGQSMFDLFYDELRSTYVTSKPSERIADFIIEEMESWGTRGISITADDIDAAIAGALFLESNDGLCQGKNDMSGNPYSFIQGGSFAPGSCISLQNDILALLSAEQEIEQLGTDLMTLVNSAELSIADEPHRPLDMAMYALLLRRVWSGTGASVIPWPGGGDTPNEVDQKFDKLNSDLAGLSPRDLDEAVLRFHHGYFRDEREADPRFDDVQTNIHDSLRDLAEKLGITGDPEAVGVFSTPALQARNVAFWARRDDLGLMWKYPSHSFRLKIKVAGSYPEMVEDGENLAYPFAYSGSSIPSGAGIASPLCSRMLGRQGYLCRPMPKTVENCENTGDGSSITLVKCSEEVTETKSGPLICPGFKNLFTDTGLPLEDPSDPGHINPALTKADFAKICSPERKVIYQDDITSNACYIALCLQQSMSGHTLVPNRSPVVLNEATSPYLACIRPDPQLGLYTEIAEDSPYPLPEYLGALLVRDFERQYCSKNGDAPQALFGLCGYNDNENASYGIENPLANSDATSDLHTLLRDRGDEFNAIAASIGQRVALDQSIELERKMFAKLAHFIEYIAALFQQLERAPLTQSACPWTGMFRSSEPSP